MVLVLFSLVGTCLLSSISTGLKVYKKAVIFGLKNRNRLNLERLCLDLRRTCRDPGIGFYGTQNDLRFASVFDDRIWQISYNYNTDKSALMRSASSKKSLKGAVHKGPERRFFFGIKEVDFSYYGCCKCGRHCAFYPQWNYDLSGIPLAVRVRLLLKDGRIIEKIVPIPISK